MKIKCEKCGNKINLDESLKNLMFNEAIEKYKNEIKELHDQEIKNIKADYEKSFKEKESLIEDGFINKLKLMEERYDQIKDKELNLEKEKMILQEKVKEASLVAEMKTRKAIEKKEIELKKIKDEELKKQIKEYKVFLQNEMANKIKEKELENQRLIKEAEDARSKLNHASNSQELVGEAAEILLLERLKSNFSFDEFEEIKKGQEGADIYQTVCTKYGEKVGSILYESKKTKNWSESWVSKFKDDIRKKGASIGILVSKALPNYCKDVFYKNGIWITSPRFVLFVAAACSKEIHSVHKAKAVKAGKSSLEGAVYDYITGNDFIERFKVISESLTEQLNDLEREQKAFQKLWRTRRKQIDKSQISLVEIFGDLDALSDGNIKSIEDFQLSID